MHQSTDLLDTVVWIFMIDDLIHQSDIQTRKTKKKKKNASFYLQNNTIMRSQAIFKWAKGDHKMLTLYYNPNVNNQYKWYLMLNFAHTKVSQTVNWKTLWNFENAKTVNFGIELSWSIDELWTFARYLEKDPTLFKDADKSKDGKWYQKSFLHKQWKSDKCLYLWQFETGWSYISIHDRVTSFSVMIPLSTSEMHILAKYVDRILFAFWDENVRSNDKQSVGDDTTSQTIDKIIDDVPF